MFNAPEKSSVTNKALNDVTTNVQTTLDQGKLWKLFVNFVAFN